MADTDATLTPDLEPPVARLVEDRWPSDGAPPETVETLAFRSRLLAGDRSIVNYGGGNTSMKVRTTDHVGRPVDVLWVKGSGSDLATIEERGFTGLRQAEILPLLEREEMSDEEMIAHLSRCQLAPDMPRCSIETLLHGFLPFKHVDHTHPDAILMICGCVEGERLAAECFGDDAIWIPYLRPGFSLAKLVAEAVAQRPRARMVLLESHGLVTWGDTSYESYASTLHAINQAAEFVRTRAAGYVRFGGQARAPLSPEQREEVLAGVLPVLRGAVSQSRSKILHVDAGDAALEFASSRDGERLAGVGAACPDHLVHTKRTPLWVAFDPDQHGPEQLADSVRAGVARFRHEYEAYYAEHSDGTAPMADPDPRIVVIEGVGVVTVGHNERAARLSDELFERALAVMAGAEALGGFASLGAADSFAVEYWPLELYKLTLAPAPRQLSGKVALVTGGAGGIGSASVRALAAEGACVVVADVDAEGAEAVAAAHGEEGLAASMDVTDEGHVAAAFRSAVLRYGGVDIVVSNAGLGSGAPIEKTTLADWERNHDVLARGYFLVAREAFRVLRRQGLGGSIVFIASKNALVAGKGAAAYSTAKAVELHLARCLAEEGGADGIRVNSVNPDAVLQGSRIWSSQWREARAANYGIQPDELEAYYSRRTTLKVNILPEDVARAVVFFASPAQSAKSTGNVINVDGGVSAAFPR